ncbi:hypothetical protein MmiAt1_01330 [Methanimicrococcus sp. At1]|uniref:Uncharacterized protein n=1 Tax=Methanimicrococcus hacksteinii TaxID=3028293 RepID=A0ABU3VMH6_9EURY|nr:hypothetical protein [Methanimicrococcus sp. At1]MDV0444604.1 hypothetical protein [Methanimicrococcus sp. At1]
MHHLIFSTSARYASVGTDYLAVSVSVVTLPFPFAAATLLFPFAVATLLFPFAAATLLFPFAQLPCRFHKTVADLPACLLPPPFVLSAFTAASAREPHTFKK